MMNSKGILSGLAFLMAFVVLIMILPGCGRRQNPQGENKVAGGNTAENNVPLFDGRTLDGWKTTNFGAQGPVTVSGGKIILGMGDGCTGITWEKDFPAMNYEVALDAMRTEGYDFFCGLTFPVGIEYCSLIVGGWAGSVVGISCIDGSDASENETTTYQSFDNNKWYHIRLLVTEKQIQAWIDTTKVVDLEKGNKRLTVRPEVELSKPFGIASWMTTAALKNITLRDIPVQ